MGQGEGEVSCVLIGMVCFVLGYAWAFCRAARDVDQVISELLGHERTEHGIQHGEKAGE
mgnify:CR=1 FL=1